MPGSDREDARSDDGATAHSIEVPLADDLDADELEPDDLEPDDLEPDDRDARTEVEPPTNATVRSASAPVANLPPTKLVPIAVTKGAFAEPQTEVGRGSTTEAPAPPERPPPRDPTVEPPPAPPRPLPGAELEMPAAPALATGARRIPWRRVATAVLGTLMAAGAIVISHHLLTLDDRPAAGPLRLVERPAVETVTDASELTADPEDATRPIPELERRAVRHLAAGRLEAAGRAYVTLARRVPHEPAYAVAARVLAQRARR